jgi:hypothetical protein
VSKPTWDSDAPDSELDLEEFQRRHYELQRRYPGQSIARRGGRVIASAPTYEELSARLRELGEPWDEALIGEYIFRTDVIYIL